MERETRLKRQAEEILGCRFEEGLAAFVTKNGLTRGAEILGVSASLLRYWMRVQGIQTAYIALSPDDQMQIIRSSDRELAGVS